MAETTHVTRRVSRNSADAATVAARWHRGLDTVAGTSHVRCANRLWLRGEPEPTGPNPLEIYAARGVLWVAGRPVAVTLEVSLWSTTEIQVGLRPKRLCWPVRTDGFARSASRTLDEVVRVLSGPAVRRWQPDQTAPAAASRRDPVPSAA